MSANSSKTSGARTANGTSTRLRKTGLTEAATETSSPQTAGAPGTTTPSSSSTPTNASSSPTPATPLVDPIVREKGPSPLGTLTYILLRLFDVSYQLLLLRYGLGGYILTFLPIKSYIVPHRLPAEASYFNLGLTPYHTIIFLLSVIAATRQIFHVLFISEQRLLVTTAVTLAGTQTLFNTGNTLFSLWSRSSNAPRVVGSSQEVGGVREFFSSPAFIPKPPTSTEFTITFYFGVFIFVLGILMETISEVQRRAFKARAANKGKPFADGLFKVATHINLGGYMLWRGGAAVCAGKLSWGMLTAYMIGYSFYTKGIPVLEQYLVGKYGDAYKKIQKDIEWRLLPGIY